jgi:hypothetical protein
MSAWPFGVMQRIEKAPDQTFPVFIYGNGDQIGTPVNYP